jgi:hypothetical protein
MGIIFFIIFIIVFFLYIHIVHQYKTSDDLEIYEMDYINNSNLQEVCNIRQPVLFQIPELGEIDIATLFENENTEKEEVQIKDTDDYWNTAIDSVDYLNMPLRTALPLMKTDTRAHYISENNTNFLNETGIMANQEVVLDNLLKPSFTVYSKYDILFGSVDASTPLRYHTNDRVYLSVLSGKIRVKMTPWKSRKYLHYKKDYENYEFLSPINVWNTQKEWLNDMDKLKFLEFDVLPGNVLFVPPYWGYSIHYLVPDTVIYSCQYNTIMNLLGHINDIGMYYLQNQNIVEKRVKTKDLNNTIPLEESSETVQIAI